MWRGKKIFSESHALRDLENILFLKLLRGVQMKPVWGENFLRNKYIFVYICIHFLYVHIKSLMGCIHQKKNHWSLTKKKKKMIWNFLAIIVVT